MPNRWKLVGLAGLAGVAATGVAATGVVVARRRRATADVSADELRDRLHGRLAAVPQPPVPFPEPPPLT